MDAVLADDALWRTLFYVALAVSAAVFLLGGLAGTAAGHWQVEDGTRWRLVQRGPFVRGTASVPGGQQRLRGTVWFGHLWLSRRSHGREHLMRLGFSREEAAEVEGQITGTFRFWRAGRSAWTGTFTGRSFRFAEGGGFSVGLAAPAPRRLERIG